MTFEHLKKCRETYTIAIEAIKTHLDFHNYFPEIVALSSFPPLHPK